MYLTIIPVCAWHEARATRQFAGPLQDALADLKEEVAGHECDGQKAVSAYLAERADWHLERNAEWRSDSLAYFIRCGQYIKIGVAASPRFRLDTIRNTGGVLAPRGLDLSTAELLATEPGGFDRERELHDKFSHLRHTGEWFTKAPELIEYIESIRVTASRTGE